MELGVSEKQLLEISAKELLKLLNEDKKPAILKQKAFQFLLENDEEVQVQVLVTRDQSDFLDDFQTEIISNY